MTLRWLPQAGLCWRWALAHNSYRRRAAAGLRRLMQHRQDLRRYRFTAYSHLVSRAWRRCWRAPRRLAVVAHRSGWFFLAPLRHCCACCSWRPAGSRSADNSRLSQRKPCAQAFGLLPCAPTPVHYQLFEPNRRSGTPESPPSRPCIRSLRGSVLAVRPSPPRDISGFERVGERPSELLEEESGQG